ncbi:YgaP family membrane protein [Marinomonas sp.]|uniref:YgaP family membrane protein n=1 Tax=Marinomonas sp. TaxID=1904862 RepID=UPI003BA8E6FC
MVDTTLRRVILANAPQTSFKHANLPDCTLVHKQLSFSSHDLRQYKQEKTMIYNVGTTDRVIRIAIGAVVIAIGVYFNSWWGAIGIVLLATGVFSICPAYLPFGFSTCKTKK